MFATVINAVGIVAAAGVGSLIGKRLGTQGQEPDFTAFGLLTLYFGVQAVSSTQNGLIVLVSLVLGGLLGTRLRLQQRMENMAKHPAFGDHPQFGLVVSTFILFCVGPRTILGALNEGLLGDSSVLLAKAAQDILSTVFFAAASGPILALTAIPVFVFQGSLTLLAGSLRPFLFAQALANFSGVGGILLLSQGIDLLGLKKISVADYLPALVLVVALSQF